MVALQGTPHIWLADAQGQLHWGGDTRARHRELDAEPEPVEEFVTALVLRPGSSSDRVEDGVERRADRVGPVDVDAALDRVGILGHPENRPGLRIEGHDGRGLPHLDSRVTQGQLDTLVDGRRHVRSGRTLFTRQFAGRRARPEHLDLPSGGGVANGLPVVGESVLER